MVGVLFFTYLNTTLPYTNQTLKYVDKIAGFIAFLTGHFQNSRFPNA